MLIIANRRRLREGLSFLLREALLSLHDRSLARISPFRRA
jgi:hypothetical protein